MHSIGVIWRELVSLLLFDFFNEGDESLEEDDDDGDICDGFKLAILAILRDLNKCGSDKNDNLLFWYFSCNRFSFSISCCCCCKYNNCCWASVKFNANCCELLKCGIDVLLLWNNLCCLLEEEHGLE